MLTQYHVAFAYTSNITVVSLINQQVVFSKNCAPLALRSISTDYWMKRTLLVSKEAPVLASQLQDEGIDAWRQFLAKGMIKEALATHKTKEQKEYLAGVYADQQFEKGKHVQAAEIYVESNRPFEEVTLKFMQLNSKSGDAGIERYLLSVLEKYEKRAAAPDKDRNHPNEAKENELAQRIVLTTWLLELKLNTLEEAQSQAEFKKDPVFQQGVDKLEKEFFEFIDKQMANLQEDTVFELL